MSDAAGPARLLVVREVTARARTKAFKVTTALLVVAAALGVALPSLLGGGDDGPTEVKVGLTRGVTPGTRASVAALSRSGGLRDVKIEIRRAASESEGSAAVAQGDIDVLITPTRLLLQRGEGGGATGQVVSTVAELLRLQQGLRSAGISGEQAQQVLGARGPAVAFVRGASDKASDRAQFPLALTGSIVLYMVLIFYGQMVSGGVNEEKSSRVVELLLATVEPRKLLAAKVAGIGLVGLIQVGAAAAAAGVAAVVTGADLPSGSVLTVVGYLAWFILGYALYCTLFAAAGALTSRPEEAQQAATPLYLLLGVGYGSVFASLGAPDGLPATVLSFMPFTSPLVMPVRAAIGTVAPWQIAVSMAIRAATTVVALRFAARVYAGALLQFGKRVKIRDSLRPA